MKQQGWYLTYLNDVPCQGDLYFWGEWEPQSEFDLIGNAFGNRAGLPHAIHHPLFQNQNIGCHNTDPFVFGDHFYYTNCKQKQTHNGKKMLSLPTGSVILFGSEINKSDFVLDTVFVVSDNKENVGQYRTHPNHYPPILRQATIDLNGGLSSWHMLYKGEMYDFSNPYSENNKYAFCFSPCKINSGKQGFARPIIDWRKFNLQKPGAGSVLYTVKGRLDFDFWYELVDYLVCSGFALGIRLDLPQIVQG